MKRNVEIIFDKYIKKTMTKVEVANYLIDHERKVKCIEAICKQIRMAEISNIGKAFSTDKYLYMIRECAKLFCHTALTHLEEQTISYNERQKRIHESDHIKRAEETMVDLENESKTMISRPGDIVR